MRQIQMNKRCRVREWGLKIGDLPPAANNSFTDVPGIKVGHQTLIRGEGELQPGQGPVRTGVTAIKPHPGNIFKEKVPAACEIINGFGKSVGLPQIQETGLLETPILLTNTLNVGRVADALIDYMLEENPEIGIDTGTVNPVVGECNDAYLNDIQGRHVGKEDVFTALKESSPAPVKEGAVGAGTGMSTFGFKGGIGTSSRLLRLENEEYVLGVLVLSNFGKKENLKVAGYPVGRYLKDDEEDNKEDDGSIIILLATDLPLNARQLKRMARRVPAGLGRVGSILSHGSGDFVLAFSTGRRIPHQPEHPLREDKYFFDHKKEVNLLFKAVVEGVEEAVLNALFTASTMEGRDGNLREALPLESLEELINVSNFTARTDQK